MVLTKENISWCRECVASMADEVSWTTGVRNKWYNQIQSHQDYNEWKNGTEIGAKFESNLAQLEPIARQLDDQYNNLVALINKFLDRQEEINTTGK